MPKRLTAVTSVPERVVVLEGELHCFGTPMPIRNLNRSTRVVPASSRSMYPEIAFSTVELQIIASQIDRNLCFSQINRILPDPIPVKNQREDRNRRLGHISAPARFICPNITRVIDTTLWGEKHHRQNENNIELISGQAWTITGLAGIQRVVQVAGTIQGLPICIVSMVHHGVFETAKYQFAFTGMRAGRVCNCLG